MSRLLRPLSIAGALLVAACGPKESPPPAGTPAVVSAKEGDTTLSVAVDRTAVEVGQPLRLTVTVESPDGSVPPPTVPAKLGPFDVHPAMAAGPTGGKGSRTAQYELTTLEAGEVELPPIELVLGEGTDAKRVATAAIPVQVASLIGEDSDPAHYRDIKGPLDLLPRSVPWGLVGGGAATLLTLAIAAWLVFRKRAEQVEPQLAPHAWAGRELDRLEAARLLEAGRFHDFHVLLTDIVRGYVERRFGIRAPELTTPEFLREAKRSTSMGESHQLLLGSFLRAADLIKFAGVQPALDDSEKALATARRFVTESSAASIAPPAAPTLSASGASA